MNKKGVVGLLICLVLVAGCSEEIAPRRGKIEPFLVQIGSETNYIKKFCDKDNGNLIYRSHIAYGESMVVVVGGCTNIKD